MSKSVPGAPSTVESETTLRSVPFSSIVVIRNCILSGRDFAADDVERDGTSPLSVETRASRSIRIVMRVLIAASPLLLLNVSLIYAPRFVDASALAPVKTREVQRALRVLLRRRGCSQNSFGIPLNFR